MARSLPKLILITLIFSLTIFAAQSQTSARSLSIEAGPRRSEKLSHLHLCLHEVFAGPNCTATHVASAPTTSQSATSCGAVFVLGMNSLALEVMEIAITGGTGAFQLARGYVRTKTHSIDRTSGLLVSDYDVYVLHY